MRTLATDSNNDIYISLDNLAAVNNLLAVLQCCEHAVKAQFNEMVLSYDQGVPNFQTIWSSSQSVIQYEAFLRRAILSVQNVTAINSLDITVQNNSVIYRAEIVTIYGTGLIGENNGAL